MADFDQRLLAMIGRTALAPSRVIVEVTEGSLLDDPERVRGTLVQWPERNERKRRWHDLAQASKVAADQQLAELLATIQWDHKTAM